MSFCDIDLRIFFLTTALIKMNLISLPIIAWVRSCSPKGVYPIVVFNFIDVLFCFRNIIPVIE